MQPAHSRPACWRTHHCPTNCALPCCLPALVQMCVVKVNPAAASLQLADPLPGGTGSSSSGSGGRLAASGSGGRLVPAIDGSGGMVEIVSPHDVLQPGLYETWLVSEGASCGAVEWQRTVAASGALQGGAGKCAAAHCLPLCCPASCDRPVPFNLHHDRYVSIATEVPYRTLSQAPAGAWHPIPPSATLW